MGTRGLYIFRYKNKWYVFYNHWDSYPCGLGTDIIKELKTIDFERVKELLILITKDNAEIEGLNFEGLMKALENPYDYDIRYIGEGQPTNKTFDIEYEYTINLDYEMFEVSYYSEESGSYNTQRFDLHAIPDNWASYIV